MSSPDVSPALFVVGASHQTTPIDLRERLALTPEKLAQLHDAASRLAGLRELAVVNTCNRVELYGVATDANAVAALEQEFCRLSGLDPATFATIRRLADGSDAIRHLVAVASGLESQMLGENEIFGQVKSAYEGAQQRRSVGPVLNRVFLLLDDTLPPLLYETCLNRLYSPQGLCIHPKSYSLS